MTITSAEYVKNLLDRYQKIADGEIVNAFRIRRGNPQEQRIRPADS